MNSISQPLLTWWDIHGRKDLPWQQNKTAYTVWLSEIMLQQTQVKTVIPYYQKFLTSFPTVSHLADANEDTVLQHWAGLGYYARARNLHKTAKIVSREFDGIFPHDPIQLEALPGIGKSTAGAIASSAYDQPTAILDGNVKRVLTRYHGITEWPGSTGALKELWQLSESATPNVRTADYNQAMMDLGATLCKRNKPECDRCPLLANCYAATETLTAEIPARKPKKEIPVKKRIFVIYMNSGKQVHLEKRPDSGIWGSLYSFPEFESLDELNEHLSLRDIKGAQETLKPLVHKFSHYTLQITPIRIQLSREWHTIANSNSKWVSIDDAIETLGLPTPVKSILLQLDSETHH